jgi:ankyrin repeat protein
MYEAAAKARAGDLAYFQALSALELGSLLVGRDEDGRTLLHTAAAEGHLELLQLLIAAGATKVVNKHDDEVSLVLTYPCAPNQQGRPNTMNSGHLRSCCHGSLFVVGC